MLAFWQRPKVLAYLVAIGLLLSSIIARTIKRPDVSITATRASGSAYLQLPEDRLGNTFLLRITNNTSAHQMVSLTSITDGAVLLCGQCTTTLGPHQDIEATGVVSFEKRLVNQVGVLRNGTEGESIEVPLIGPM